MDPEKKPVEVYAEKGETKLPEVDPDELKALALAYAKYLAKHDLEPGEPTFTDTIPETEITEETETAAETADAEENAEAAEKPAEAEPTDEAEKPAETEKSAETEKAEKTHKKDRKKQKKVRTDRKSRKLFAAAELSQEQIAALAEELEKAGRKTGVMARVIDFHDRLQNRDEEAGMKTRQNFIKAAHNIISTYRQSRRTIGIALLLIGIIAAVILAVFDRYTVYEYAYNGMTLGYVSSQEEITDVLDVAGTMMTQNSSGGTEIRFTANENVTFKLVDGRDKSLDDADMALNKLVYMTDIETEAFGVYDGDKLAAVVKSNEDAENLLADAKAVLSEPDEGMRIVSADFSNQLDIRPINVLLTSVQSNDDALEMMTEGGSMEIYHIVEEGEDANSLSAAFGTDAANIFNEDNSETATDIRQGDKVCIHEIVDPVSVKLVETGRMKQIIEYETNNWNQII